ncbi:MAG: hypothetical protein KME55_27805 [Nostoc indistinguendum CM1-VF10]|jgi:hypothetical protein|nr:hypothetical protein [Nostoc indistinguendum CM1-VF10]
MSSKAKISLANGIKYAIFGAILAFAMSLATTVTEDPKTGQLQFKYIASLIVGSAGLIPGWLFALIQAYEDGLQAYEEELKNLKEKQDYYFKELSLLIDNSKIEIEKFSNLADKAEVSIDHYETIKHLLGSDKNKRDLIARLITRAMDHIGYIPNARPGYFYEILTEGIPLAFSWYGIHHGPISTLGKNPLDPAGFDYFDTLNNSKINNKKRLIILNNKDEQELKDPDIMREFWNKNDKVTSYWISESTFYSLQGVEPNLKVDDCALYNDSIFLHYNRSKELVMLLFGDSNEPIFRAVKATFDALNKYINGRDSYIKFNKITTHDIP